MSIFNDDRATLNEAAMALDEAITQSGMDNAVKKAFEDAGFTNITCVAHEIDFNENNVFEGSVLNL